MKWRTITICMFLLPTVLACSGSSQIGGWQDALFSETPITQTSKLSVTLGNKSTTEEQHLVFAGFEPYSNTGGHFRVDSFKVGDKVVNQKDIVVPPGSVLTMNVSYTPLDLETTKANYGGWETGQPERWEPKPISQVEREREEAANGEAELPTAVHRALLQLMYDSPQEGILHVHLVGKAVPGPNGEYAVAGASGECSPGDGTTCYSGGFALDLPALLPDGPKDLEFSGSIPISITGGSASMRMSSLPPALLYLRSSEISQLPSGVTATMIITGVDDAVAEGSFDGSRLTLSGVALRVRVVLGELDISAVSPGMAAIVDFNLSDLEITTIEPFAQGNIVMQIETTLGNAPSGNELFDQFLGGVDITAIFRG